MVDSSVRRGDPPVPVGHVVEVVVTLPDVAVVVVVGRSEVGEVVVDATVGVGTGVVDDVAAEEMGAALP